MNGDAMDVDIEVDDLFGDGVGISLAPGPQPPSKALLQRIDDMRRTGACRAIAWSPGGTIASVTPDGRSVEFRFLRSHPDTGEWALSEPTLYHPWGPLPQGAAITHLVWSCASSPELAIVDSFGRITIVMFNVMLNRPFFERRWDSDPLDDLHAVVGSGSLMTPAQHKQKIACTYGPAQRRGTSISYPYTYIPHMGPSNPYPGKSAFVFVTTNGTLKVLYAQANVNRVGEKTLELESITSGDDSVTHACICSDRGTLLIALATASKQLRIVRVHVNFSPSPEKQHPTQIVLNLEEKHVAATNWFEPGTSESPLHAAMDQLSRLEIVPSTCEDLQKGKWDPPVVYAVRSHVPSPDPSYSQEWHTTVDRWEVLADQAQTLHPAFSQLASKRGGAGQPAVVCSATLSCPGP